MKRKKRTNQSGRKSLRYRGTKCLNCGHPLDRSDAYCPSCSQINSDKQLSAKDFFSEFLSSILVYDSRLRCTLKDLLFRPGVITKNYVAGQRLKYANPFRFFLSVSIIYFLLESFAGFIVPPDQAQLINYKPTNESPTQTLIDSLFIDNPPSTFSKPSHGDTLKAKTLGINYYYSEKLLDTLPFLESYSKRSALYSAYYYRNKIEATRAALDSLEHPDNFKNRWVYSRAISLYKITHNTEDFVNYVIAKLPFFLFFFTPVFAFFFWLSYSRKKYTYMEHIIFVFHIFSFIFLTMLIFKIPEILVGFDFFQVLLFVILGPLYFYLALRKFYEQGKWRTLFKFVFLNIVFFVSFIGAIGIFVAASAAIY
ncbi:DUF3667 domain-containing protein [Aequorivita marina]|uniref:DUF3667 domain-containing protein n=1 Tax=Aequorivita marina TaxID=3073654 RepID=UPI002876AA97|nr:DUF3667 domain-containing protein [Aequorivita sp. S2608]MDS1298262.1 DUF3667 domain-containing protein [Aequorivita sp. S2608]